LVLSFLIDNGEKKKVNRKDKKIKKT